MFELYTSDVCSLVVDILSLVASETSSRIIFSSTINDVCTNTNGSVSNVPLNVSSANVLLPYLEPSLIKTVIPN